MSTAITSALLLQTCAPSLMACASAAARVGRSVAHSSNRASLAEGRRALLCSLMCMEGVRLMLQGGPTPAIVDELTAIEQFCADVRRSLDHEEARAPELEAWRMACADVVWQLRLLHQLAVAGTALGAPEWPHMDVR